MITTLNINTSTKTCTTQQVPITRYLLQYILIKLTQQYPNSTITHKEVIYRTTTVVGFNSGVRTVIYKDSRNIANYRMNLED